MIIRHVVQADNVDESLYVIDPKMARHCLIKDKRLFDLSGRIDPLTHLNLDFPPHRMAYCVVAEKLQKGSQVFFGNEGLLLARVRRIDYAHYGRVDFTQRRLKMIKAVRELRRAKGGKT